MVGQLMALFGNVEADTQNGFDMSEDTEPKSIPFTQIDDAPMPEPKKTGRSSKIKTEMQNIYTAAGIAVFAFDQPLGSLIADNAENCAVAWDELAKTNPNVKRMLENFMQTSAYGSIIAAHMPIAVAVATKYVPHLRNTYETVFNQENQSE